MACTVAFRFGVHDFTPVHAVVGGVLIALSLADHARRTGRIAGLSGVVGGLLVDRDCAVARVVCRRDARRRCGLRARAPPKRSTWGRGCRCRSSHVAGVLVGLGTRLGNGCTSGHGLCGMSRLSKRSIIATMTFFGDRRRDRDDRREALPVNAHRASSAARCSRAGVCISGMVRPSKVLGFLDFGGPWDASLPA